MHLKKIQLFNLKALVDLFICIFKEVVDFTSFKSPWFPPPTSLQLCLPTAFKVFASKTTKDTWWLIIVFMGGVS